MVRVAVLQQVIPVFSLSYCLRLLHHLCRALVEVYTKVGFMDDACTVFWSLDESDNVVWNVLLVGTQQNGQAQRGHIYFKEFITMGRT